VVNICNKLLNINTPEIKEIIEFGAATNEKSQG
jgi:hypothetical protein